MAHGIPYSNIVTSGLSYVHARQISTVTYSLTRYSPVALLLLRLHTTIDIISMTQHSMAFCFGVIYLCNVGMCACTCVIIII